MNHKLTPDERKQALGRLQAFFLDQRDEELSELGAALLLDFIEEQLGPYFHNQGVRAAKQLVGRVASALDEELDGLERLPPRR